MKCFLELGLPISFSVTFAQDLTVCSALQEPWHLPTSAPPSTSHPDPSRAPRSFSQSRIRFRVARWEHRGVWNQTGLGVNSSGSTRQLGHRGQVISLFGAFNEIKIQRPLPRGGRCPKVTQFSNWQLRFSLDIPPVCSAPGLCSSLSPHSRLTCGSAKGGGGGGGCVLISPFHGVQADVVATGR